MWGIILMKDILLCISVAFYDCITGLHAIFCIASLLLSREARKCHKNKWMLYDSGNNQGRNKAGACSCQTVNPKGK